MSGRQIDLSGKSDRDGRDKRCPVITAPSNVPRARTARPDHQIGGVVLGGDSQGLGIARSLGRHGIPVCVIDDETSISRASRFVQHVGSCP